MWKGALIVHRRLIWVFVVCVTLCFGAFTVKASEQVLPVPTTASNVSANTTSTNGPGISITPTSPTPSSADSGSGNAMQQAANTARNAIQKAAESQLDTLPTSKIDTYWRALEAEYGGYLPNVTGPSLVRAVLGNGAPSFTNLVNGLLKYFFNEVLDDARLLGGILILAVIAAVFESMQSAFEHNTVSRVAYMVVFLVLMMLAIHSFMETMGAARHAIQTMNHFMLATIPLTVTLLAASGAVASAAFFQPMLIFTVHFISNVIFTVVFPLIFFSAVLDLTSSLSERYQLTRLASLMRAAGLAVLGFSLAAFIGITTIQGAGKGIADGVVLRTMKFGVSTFIPVIGKSISDAAETVLSASLLVKNAVGIAGLIILCLIAVFPALKILAVSLMYNGSAALMQPLGETPMIACLATLGKTLILVFACVAAVGLMFFFAICILLATANLAVITA